MSKDNVSKRNYITKKAYFSDIFNENSIFFGEMTSHLGTLIEHVNFMETTYNYVGAFINVLSIKFEHIKILLHGLPTLRDDNTGRPS